MLTRHRLESLAVRYTREILKKPQYTLKTLQKQMLRILTNNYVHNAGIYRVLQDKIAKNQIKMWNPFQQNYTKKARHKIRYFNAAIEHSRYTVWNQVVGCFNG